MESSHAARAPSEELGHSLKRSEKALQQSIVEVLEMQTWTVLQYAVPGGHGALRGAVPVGHTDLLALKKVRYGGFRALFLEVKLPGKTPTPQQEEFMECMRQAGARACVVSSVDALLNVLWAVGDEVRMTVR